MTIEITRPTVIDGAEVFDSDGTLALTIDGFDVLYLSKCSTANMDEEQAAQMPKLTDEQHQKIIDIICEALKVNEE